MTDLVEKLIQISHELDQLYLLLEIKELTFHKINEVIINYLPLYLRFLNKKTEIEKLRNQIHLNYEVWYSMKYSEIRDELNPRNISSQKWLSTKEIEMVLKHRYMDEYIKYQEAVRWADSVYEKSESLNKSWMNYGFMLNRLCDNLVTETNTLSVGS